MRRLTCILLALLCLWLPAYSLTPSEENQLRELVIQLRAANTQEAEKLNLLNQQLQESQEQLQLLNQQLQDSQKQYQEQEKRDDDDRKET